MVSCFNGVTSTDNGCVMFQGCGEYVLTIVCFKGVASTVDGCVMFQGCGEY